MPEQIVENYMKEISYLYLCHSPARFYIQKIMLNFLQCIKQTLFYIFFNAQCTVQKVQALKGHSLNIYFFLNYPII